MTAAELIAVLQRLDPDRLVMIDTDSGYWNCDNAVHSTWEDDDGVNLPIVLLKVGY